MLTHAKGLLWNAQIPRPTETRAPVSVEALVALAEVRADDVAAASVGVTPVCARGALVLVWKGDNAPDGKAET